MGKRYTNVELNAIREMGKTMTAAEIARQLGRPTSSVFARASAHGIKLNSRSWKHHTMGEAKEIVRLRQCGMKFREIAEATGVALSSCIYLYRTHS